MSNAEKSQNLYELEGIFWSKDFAMVAQIHIYFNENAHANKILLTMWMLRCKFS